MVERQLSAVSSQLSVRAFGYELRASSDEPTANDE